MARMNCVYQPNENHVVGSNATEGLTVGEIFYYSCNGDWPKISPKTVELRLDKENLYKLRLLNLEFKSSNEARLTVTSYEVGQHKLPAVQLVDGENSILLGDLQFTVKSVMDPQNPAKEPLGPLGPFHLMLAPIYWISVLIGVLLILSYVGNRIYQRRQKKKLLAKMEIDQYSQSPLNQFYATTRKLLRSTGISDGEELSSEKKQQYILDLEKSLNLYVARKYLIPTDYWKPRRISGDLKRNYPDIYDVLRADLRKLFAEFSRAKKNSQQKDSKSLSNRDCLQLAEMSRKFVELSELSHRRSEAQ